MVLDEKGVYIHPACMYLRTFYILLFFVSRCVFLLIRKILTFLSYLRCLANVHIFRELHGGGNV